jgi:hypothetical protein
MKCPVCSETPRDPHPRHDRRDDDYYRHGKKRKSIWHEIFD